MQREHGKRRAVGIGAWPSRPQAGETPALRAAEHREWYSRGYLPHFDLPDLVQFITFRLADALPLEVARRIEEELRRKGQPSDAEKHERIEAFLDAGHGSCALRDPQIASVVEQALLHFDGQRYRLLEWVIMPNHVHTLIETTRGHPLGVVLHSWKSFTSHAANKILGARGTFWRADFFDRYIRNQRHYESIVAYIRNNPMAAGLVDRPETWPFGSAARLAHKPS